MARRNLSDPEPFVSKGVLVIGIVVTILSRATFSQTASNASPEYQEYLGNANRFVLALGIAMIVTGLLGLLNPVLHPIFHRLTRRYRLEKKGRTEAQKPSQQQPATPGANYAPLLPQHSTTAMQPAQPTQPASPAGGYVPLMPQGQPPTPQSPMIAIPQATAPITPSTSPDNEYAPLTPQASVAASTSTIPPAPVASVSSPPPAPAPISMPPLPAPPAPGVNEAPSTAPDSSDGKRP